MNIATAADVIPGREVRLKNRPSGMPKPGDFETVDVQLPDPAAGQVLIRNTWMSLDPALRRRLRGEDSYLPGIRVGESLDGAAVGVVERSNVVELPVGSVVVHRQGWRDLALVDASIPEAVRLVDVGAAPPAAYLGVLGHTGFSAFIGMKYLADLHPGDVVLVSGAAGAVGAIAGQFAILAGCRVLGSVGSAVKAEYLVDELGFDGAMIYSEEPVGEAISRLAPDGIDVYFDNVGGDHLNAAIAAARVHGRIVMCGAVSDYNREQPVGLTDPFAIVAKRLTVAGFLVRDHSDLRAEFERQVAALLGSGRLVERRVETYGLDQAASAFIAMLRGERIGKALVRLVAD